jgi:DNA-binding NarL/FixJ family response regulator
MKRITVLLADDNRVVRRGFRKILELEDNLEVVGEAKNGLPRRYWTAPAAREKIDWVQSTGSASGHC